MCTAFVSPNRLCRSPRISWYAPVRKTPSMYGSPSRHSCSSSDGLPLLLADEAVDLPVGVAGDVLQRAAPRRLLVQPVDRHDREELVDGPAVRQRLEEREVAEVPVHQHRVEIGEDVLVRRRDPAARCARSRSSWRDTSARPSRGSRSDSTPLAKSCCARSLSNVTSWKTSFTLPARHLRLRRAPA